jgi:hypothetical protein
MQGEKIDPLYDFNIFGYFPPSQNQINGCKCSGPDASLNTKIGQTVFCHILMSLDFDRFVQESRIHHLYFGGQSRLNNLF